MSGDFVTQLDNVPVTRTARQKLKELAKVLELPEEAAAGYAIERYIEDHGEQRIRIEKAKEAAQKARRNDDNQRDA